MKILIYHSTTALSYYGIEAFALRQKGSQKLKAEPHTEKINTRADGSKINEPRSNLGIATGVMIHIGGWYHNQAKNKNRIASSYGCFGVIPLHQIGTREKMEEWRKNDGYKKSEVSNTEYKKIIKEVVNIRGKGALHVLIKKKKKC